ncbi:MAG: zinc-binding alcohol dehydrogenase family protein [Candidatus Krumholzibacteria bacterium]|nr:zinc-binding alcohol dehydrogenase family protein [Candidatus Krumholzibacteria bacterium]
MKAIGVMKADGLALSLPGFRQFSLGGLALRCGERDIPDPAFDPESPEGAGVAAVDVRTVSVNYRDRAIICQGMVSARTNAFLAFGSEFCGEVAAIGRAVTDLTVGDRVIGVFAFPEPVAEGHLPGVVSNHCSVGRLVLPACKLMRIPSAMSDEIAAAFTLNALTVTAMLRRLRLTAGERLLVLGGGSNVSLFASSAASARGMDVTVVTTSARHASALADRCGGRVIVLDDPSGGLEGCTELMADVNERGLYAGVVDPFMDVHLMQAPLVMDQGGRYVTCGMARQIDGDAVALAVDSERLAAVFYTHLMLKNLTVMGNCLGTLADQQQALREWEAGRLIVHLDHVFGSGEELEFLERGFLDPDRLGKVVYRFGT